MTLLIGKEPGYSIRQAEGSNSSIAVRLACEVFRKTLLWGTPRVAHVELIANEGSPVWSGHNVTFFQKGLLWTSVVCRFDIWPLLILISLLIALVFYW